MAAESARNGPTRGRRHAREDLEDRPVQQERWCRRRDLNPHSPYREPDFEWCAGCSTLVSSEGAVLCGGHARPTYAAIYCRTWRSRAATKGAFCRSFLYCRNTGGSICGTIGGSPPKRAGARRSGAWRGPSLSSSADRRQKGGGAASPPNGAHLRERSFPRAPPAAPSRLLLLA